MPGMGTFRGTSVVPTLGWEAHYRHGLRYSRGLMVPHCTGGQMKVEKILQ